MHIYGYKHWYNQNRLYITARRFSTKMHEDVTKWKHFRVTGHLCGEFTGHRCIINWLRHRKFHAARCFVAYLYTMLQYVTKILNMIVPIMIMNRKELCFSVPILRPINACRFLVNGNHLCNINMSFSSLLNKCEVVEIPCKIYCNT